MQNRLLGTLPVSKGMTGSHFYVLYAYMVMINRIVNILKFEDLEIEIMKFKI